MSDLIAIGYPDETTAEAAADQVVAGVHVVIAFGVPDDHGDRIGLDDEVFGELACLVGGRLGGGLVGVSDRDQVRHCVLFLGS